MRSTIFLKEKIVLRMRFAENFPFRGKFSEVYTHLKGAYTLQKFSTDRKIFRLRMRSAENIPFRGKFSIVFTP